MVFDGFEHAGACVFDQVGDFFKSLATAVVGVGNVVGLVLTTVVGEQLDLRVVGAAGVEAADVVEVFLVGDEDQVEVIEVGDFDLAGVAADSVAPGF